MGKMKGASSAPRLASSSASSFPGKTNVRGLIVACGNRRREKTVPARSATEFEIRRKMEEQTGWREQNKSQIGGQEIRSDRLVGAAETSKERAEWRRSQQKNYSILGLLKRKEWPQCHRGSRWQVRQSRICQKEKE